MPALPNQKHEIFAQELAQGRTACDAYLTSGFKPHRANASRLSANDSIRRRVEALKGEANQASKLTKEQALGLLCAMSQDKAEAGNVRVSSLKLLGSWCGWEKGTEAENKLADTLGAGIRAHARRK